jgi:WD40 repeat protein
VLDGDTFTTVVRLPVPAVAAALSPDGERLLLVRESGALELRDARDGRLLAAPPRPPGLTVDAAFDPSGTLLALAGDDATVELRDVWTGALVRALGRHAAPVRAVRWSGDGALVFSLGSDRRVRVWDVAGGAELAALPVDGFGGLELSPDGTRLLVHQGPDAPGRVGFRDVSREPRSASTVGRLVHCLVPLRLDGDSRLVARPPDPGCP